MGVQYREDSFTELYTSVCDFIVKIFANFVVALVTSMLNIINYLKNYLSKFWNTQYFAVSHSFKKFFGLKFNHAAGLSLQAVVAKSL